MSAVCRAEIYYNFFFRWNWAKRTDELAESIDVGVLVGGR